MSCCSSGAYLPRRGDWVAIAAIGASFVLFFFVLADLLDAVKDPEFVGGGKSWTWVEFPGFEIDLGFFVDEITIVMLGRRQLRLPAWCRSTPSPT